jgi:hypothetical protein
MHSSVGRARRNSGSSSAPSNDRAIATHAPAASPANENDVDATCDADVAGRNTSPGVIASPATALATSQPNVACVCVTPLGLPVLPEVKKMNAGASASGADKAAGGASSVIRSSSRPAAPSRGPPTSPKRMRPSGSPGTTWLAAIASLRSTWATISNAPLTSSA